MVRIRSAGEADRPRVLEMARAFMTLTPYGALFTASEPHLSGLFTICMEMGVLVVAEDEASSGLIGFLALAVLEHPLSGEHYVEEVAWWVEPAHRQGSVGLRLLSWAEEWTRGAGVGMIKMVAPAGSRVGATYERLGYRAVETAYLKRL